jgi:hypothetical protein
VEQKQDLKILHYWLALNIKGVLNKMSNLDENQNNDIPSTNDNEQPVDNNINTEPQNPIDNNTVPSTPIVIPNQIEVYSYDYNGYYIGVDFAQRSPLDVEVVYLPPASSTFIKPPKVEEGKIQKWNGEGWDIVDIPKTPDDDSEDDVEKLKIMVNKQQVQLDKQQSQLNEQANEINDLKQLVNGLIMSTLKTS